MISKAHFLSVLAAGTLATGMMATGSAAAQSPTVPDQYAAKITCNANGRLDPAALSPLLPCAISTKLDNGDPVQIQQSFDTFSWESFVALNWPQDGDTIGKGKGANGDAPALWQTWMDAFAVMTANPPAWGTQAPPPKECTDAGAKSGDRVLRMVGKTPDLLEAANQPFDTGPLIDQNGLYTRFQILINKPMYDFIVGNNLNTKAGQAVYKPTITPPNHTKPTMTFPRGFQAGTSDGAKPVATAPGYEGAIMLKLAYKILGPGDDPAKFHNLVAYVYNAPQNGKPATCATQMVGMVGMHIGNKVEPFPQWVWSTFEHNRNAPSQDAVNAGKAAGHYSYYNPSCDAKTCPPNKPPARPWDPTVQPFPGGYHTQVTRLIALDPSYVAMNQKWQAPLAGTVWENYELVGTQWPTQETSQATPTGYPFPPFLANTTMETYTQGTVPQSSSSCIACHNNAIDAVGTVSDFTYILERAK